MNFIKNVRVIVAVFLVCCVTTAFAKNSAQIGLIDLERIHKESPQAEAMHAKYLQNFKKRDEDLQAKQKKFQAGVEKFKRDEELLSDAQKIKREKELKSQNEELRELAYKLQIEKQQLQETEMSGFKVILKQSINEVAKNDKFDLILVNEAALYAVSDYDVTDKVLKELQKLHRQSDTKKG